MGRINVYRCVDEHFIVTETVDQGLIPKMLRCKCGELAIMSPDPDQTLKPDAEWYKPKNLDKLSKEESDHIKKGGLLLRQA